MTSPTSKLSKLLSGQYGPSDIYRRLVRPYLPSTDEQVTYNGTPVGKRKKILDNHLPDAYKPHDEVDIPSYEYNLLRGIDQHVEQGDRVIIVGCGFGVTAVVAAKATGPTGTVTCYEGSQAQVQKAGLTLKANQVDNVVIHHAIVGRSIAVYGSEQGHAANVVAPEDIPACDVLELDCEGAETIILESLPIRPRVILVETHGCYGAPTETVRSLLASMGYAVTELGVAEPRVEQFCLKNDIKILAALKQ